MPNTRWFNNKYWHDFPYGLAILKAALGREYKVRIVDANFLNLNFDEVKTCIINEKPDYVGISCMTVEYKNSYLKIADLCKEVDPNIKTIAGGIYPTLLPKDLMDNINIDYIVLGEGENRLRKLICADNQPHLLNTIDGVGYRDAGKTIIKPIQQYIEVLDDVPFPDYSDIDFDAYANYANKYSYYNYPKKTFLTEGLSHQEDVHLNVFFAAAVKFMEKKLDIAPMRMC